jgi:hypothetical protein
MGQLEELERLQRALAAELAASQQSQQYAGNPAPAVPGRLSNPKQADVSGYRSPTTGAYRIRKLSMSMEPESSADLDDPPAEMYRPQPGTGSVVMNQHGGGCTS